MVVLNIGKLEGSTPPAPQDGVYYPESDGRPVAESEFQFIPLTYAASALAVFYADEPGMYVGANMFIYFLEGDATMSVAPDVFVIPNLDKRLRSSYFMWLEGEIPVFIMEVTSNSTWREDVGRKRELYESWGVSEYWLYDPTEETRLGQPLQGFHLAGGSYEPIRIELDGGLYRGFSAVLNLELHARRDWFRFFNPSTGEYLNNLEESERARSAERASRLNAERARFAERASRLNAERERDAERTRREELERLLKEHGIEPPS